MRVDLRDTLVAAVNHLTTPPAQAEGSSGTGAFRNLFAALKPASSPAPQIEAAPSGDATEAEAAGAVSKSDDADTTAPRETAAKDVPVARGKASLSEAESVPEIPTGAQPNSPRETPRWIIPDANTGTDTTARAPTRTEDARVIRSPQATTEPTMQAVSIFQLAPGLAAPLPTTRPPESSTLVAEVGPPASEAVTPPAAAVRASAPAQMLQRFVQVAAMPAEPEQVSQAVQVRASAPLAEAIAAPRPETGGAPTLPAHHTDSVAPQPLAQPLPDVASVPKVPQPASDVSMAPESQPATAEVPVTAAPDAMVGTAPPIGPPAAPVSPATPISKDSSRPDAPLAEANRVPGPVTRPAAAQARPDTIDLQTNPTSTPSPVRIEPATGLSQPAGNPPPAQTPVGEPIRVALAGNAHPLDTGLRQTSTPAVQPVQNVPIQALRTRMRPSMVPDMVPRPGQTPISFTAPQPQDKIVPGLSRRPDESAAPRPTIAPAGPGARPDMAMPRMPGPANTQPAQPNRHPTAEPGRVEPTQTKPHLAERPLPEVPRQTIARAVTPEQQPNADVAKARAPLPSGAEAHAAEDLRHKTPATQSPAPEAAPRQVRAEDSSVADTRSIVTPGADSTATPPSTPTNRATPREALVDPTAPTIETPRDRIAVPVGDAPKNSTVPTPDHAPERLAETAAQPLRPTGRPEIEKSQTGAVVTPAVPPEAAPGPARPVVAPTENAEMAAPVLPVRSADTPRPQTARRTQPAEPVPADRADPAARNEPRTRPSTPNPAPRSPEPVAAEPDLADRADVTVPDEPRTRPSPYAAPDSPEPPRLAPAVQTATPAMAAAPPPSAADPLPGDATVPEDGLRVADIQPPGRASSGTDSVQAQTHAPTQARAAQVVQQLAPAMKVFPDGIAEVSLSPQELGHVRMTMRIDGDAVVVHIVADRPETLDLLQRHTGQLAAALREAGFADVSYAFSQDGRQSPQRPSSPANGASTPTEPELAQMPAPAHPQQPGDRLDLRL